MSNPDLKWETTYSHNIGIDFGFWNSRLTGSVELYQSNTKDLLIKFPVTGGYSEQYRNLGEVQNRGIEVTLGAALVRKEKWGINFDANISFNKNEVVDLGGLDQITASAGMFSTEIGYDYIVKKGRPLGDIYGYVNQGMYTVDDFDYDGKTWTLKEGIASSEDILGKDYGLRPGAPRLAKVSDDDPTKITTNDITRIGNTQPLFTGGFSLTAYAYGFDVAANFTYSYGNEIYNANKIEFSTTKTTQGQNVLNTMAPSNRWTNIDWATGELVNDPALLAQMNAGQNHVDPLLDQTRRSELGHRRRFVPASGVADDRLHRSGTPDPQNPADPRTRIRNGHQPLLPDPLHGLRPRGRHAPCDPADPRRRLLGVPEEPLVGIRSQPLVLKA